MSSRKLSAADAKAGKIVTCTGAMSNKKRYCMELHMVRGSLLTGNVVGGGVGCEIMEAEVWSRLPEELIWEVLRFVPAANYFRLQLVSRQWRQTLISADFCSRSRVVVQPPVAACVTSTYAWGDHGTSHSCSSSSEVEKKVVVHIDLSSFVPDWFWKSDVDPDSDAYSVVTTADAYGLVCISSTRWNDVLWGKSSTKDYFCVLNPLTRTCKVLPDVPFDRWVWLQPTPTTLTIIGCMLGIRDDRGFHILWQGQVHVATYDLTAGGSGRWEQAAAWAPDRERYQWGPHDVALCGGEMFCLTKSRSGRRHLVMVMSRDSRPAVEVAQVEEPAPETLGLDASRCVGWCVKLVAHRGAVYLLKSTLLEMTSEGDPDVVLGVWRLARERLEWEVAARLGVADVVRLTGLKRSDVVWRETSCLLSLDCASGVREFLYCTMSVVGADEVDWLKFVVGFNLDTGDWELVHDGQGLFYDETVYYQPPFFLSQRLTHPSRSDVSSPLELRPDLFV